ncbi:hypothetical protein GCM10007977_050760 [Dactylosporangium sucinum]|uniref:Luciferase-like monooxygenase n=1 Tax=Dactylosporangium sucinum TaxID=1424081 RepID=A0A917WXR4_9ACTN|nr:hypothetical protein GCM10007977_050760 [Dactylosporangium sucinum]
MIPSGPAPRSAPADPAPARLTCPRRSLAGVAAFEDFAGRYERLGFTDIVFHDPRSDDPVFTDAPAVVDAIAARFARR